MRKFLKVLIGLVIAVSVVVAGAAAFAQFGSERKLHRTVDVEVQPVAIPTDAAALERGEYLYKSRGCAECHGQGGAGATVLDDAGFMVRAPQIAAGARSATANYTPEDWVRTIRHGVKPNREPAFIMPSEDYNRLTDADVGAIVAYVRSLPPVAGTPAELRVPLLVRFLYAAGMVKDSAEKIDHSLPPAQPFASDDVLAHGAYVAAACKGCHNESLSGGAIPGAPPDWPPAANLTPGENSALPRYADAASFAAMFRSGKRPDGTTIHPAMPFPTLREISDEDVHAMHGFLKTLPPLEQGEQP